VVGYAAIAACCSVGVGGCLAKAGLLSSTARVAASDFIGVALQWASSFYGRGHTLGMGTVSRSAAARDGAIKIQLAQVGFDGEGVTG
jgi:hypothetical protein